MTFGNSAKVVPEGQNENSPAFQRRDEANRRTSPEGTAEIMRQMSRSQPRQERDCASEASRSNGGIETCEGDFYAWCGDKLSPLRSEWGQLGPTSPEGTAEIMRLRSGIQTSLRDSKPPDTFPGVETPGYFREVPPGLQFAAKTLNFRKAIRLKAFRTHAFLSRPA